LHKYSRHRLVLANSLSAIFKEVQVGDGQMGKVDKFKMGCMILLLTKPGFNNDRSGTFALTRWDIPP